MSSHEQLTPERIAILRQMTPQQRLLAAEEMYWEARRVKARQVREMYPDWPEQEVQAEVGRIFLSESMKEE